MALVYMMASHIFLIKCCTTEVTDISTISQSYRSYISDRRGVTYPENILQLFGLFYNTG